MRRGMLGLIAVVALGGGRAVAQDLPAEARVARGALSFDGRATVGNFTGTTDSVTGAMRGGPAPAGVTGWVEGRVTALRTGNGRRDRDLRSSMETDRYPVMRYDLTAVRPGPVLGDSQQVTLEGTLTIHGVTRPVDLTAFLYRDTGTARVTSSFQLDLNDYRVGGLSKMLGILRMNPVIVVHIDVTFGPGD